MFNYGSFKFFLFKVFFGIVLVTSSIFLILSHLSYNSNDPGIGKINNNTEIILNFVFPKISIESLNT